MSCVSLMPGELNGGPAGPDARIDYQRAGCCAERIGPGLARTEGVVQPARWLRKVTRNDPGIVNRPAGGRACPIQISCGARDAWRP